MALSFGDFSPEETLGFNSNKFTAVEPSKIESDAPAEDTTADTTVPTTADVPTPTQMGAAEESGMAIKTKSEGTDMKTAAPGATIRGLPESAADATKTIDTEKGKVAILPDVRAGEESPPAEPKTEGTPDAPDVQGKPFVVVGRAPTRPILTDFASLGFIGYRNPRFRAHGAGGAVFG